MKFDELAEERHKVRDLCRKHAPSLLAFKFPNGASFSVFPVSGEQTGAQLKHLTTSATCIESLGDCRRDTIPKEAIKRIASAVGVNESILKREDAADIVLQDLEEVFYSGATERLTGDWKSEDSAPVYCVSRAFPLYLKATPKTTKAWTTKHSELIRVIFQQIADEHERFGIGELKLRPNKDRSEWYSENAYHTYWALRVLTDAHGRYPLEVAGALTSQLDHLQAGMKLWARTKLAEEVSLHWSQSATLDSDQLMWALTTFIEFGGDISSNLRDQDLIRKAFEALGSTQEKVGSWRHYGPLFVYSNVGNAYCYVYESFTYLLKALLRRFEEQEFLEDVVRGFMDRFRRLREYAEMTQVQSATDHDAISWCSGHRPGDARTEGWATASVFSYLQAYRRILGVLSHRDALRALPRSSFPKNADPVNELIDRGETWPFPGKKDSVAEDLLTLFVNPVQSGQVRDCSEPDDQPIKSWQARSAILYGPPGASKTTLVRNVACALDWEYVELHSSHFVAEGIQEVQRTADRIFRWLMELDHTVVLFDEPDELVRERNDSPDAFGRFLTTSMLPKLAELWKQRRVIYFIATNHIGYFDAAIVRSERFDLLALMSLPSFGKKVQVLKQRLGGWDVEKQKDNGKVSFGVAQEEIEEALMRLQPQLRKKTKRDAKLPPTSRLARFVLLRYDQIDELAYHLRRGLNEADPLIVTPSTLSTALESIVDHRLGLLKTYLDYIDDAEQARRDFQRKPVFEVIEITGNGGNLPSDVWQANEKVWIKCETGVCPEEHDGYAVSRTRPGAVQLTRDAPGTTRRGGLVAKSRRP